MKSYTQTLLAGVAALALIAGTGLASAQAPSKDQNPAPQAHETRGKQPASATNPGIQAQSHVKTDQTAQGANKNTEPNAQGEKQDVQRSAQSEKPEAQPNGKMEKQNPQQSAKTEKHGTERNAQRTMPNKEPQHTAKGKTTLHGLQGNAAVPMENSSNAKFTVKTSHGNVALNEQQRTQIRTILGSHRGPQVGHVDFDVRIGTAIPRAEIRTIRVVPVPETLVRIEPRWRGYEYFVFRDEIVIVNPRDLRIVAVIMT